MSYTNGACHGFWIGYDDYMIGPYVQSPFCEGYPGYMRTTCDECCRWVKLTWWQRTLESLRIRKPKSSVPKERLGK